MGEKICIYCGEAIEMEDYRSYAIIQLEDTEIHVVYVHLRCLEMDEDHPLFKTILEGAE